MDGATINARIAKGLGIAAKKVGLPYDVYRPSGVNDPLATGNKIATGVLAAFDPSSKWYSFGSPSKHGENYYNGLFDPTAIAVGDYFTSAKDTYFVLSLDHIQPPLCAQTSMTVSFVRPQGAQDVPGRGPRYGGNNAQIELAYMANWPIAVNLEKKLGSNLAALPGDAAAGAMECYVPDAGAAIETSDIMIDADGNRYVIQGVERSALGWRFVAKQAVA